jgi:hypothetical protein
MSLPARVRTYGTARVTLANDRLLGFEARGGPIHSVNWVQPRRTASRSPHCTSKVTRSAFSAVSSWTRTRATFGVQWLASEAKEMGALLFGIARDHRIETAHRGSRRREQLDPPLLGGLVAACLCAGGGCVAFGRTVIPLDEHWGRRRATKPVSGGRYNL